MRKVQVLTRKYNRDKKCYDYEVKSEGLFHHWGLNNESDEGGGSYSVAIVEEADGSVLTPEPHLIKFLDKQKVQPEENL